MADPVKVSAVEFQRLSIGADAAGAHRAVVLRPSRPARIDYPLTSTAKPKSIASPAASATV